METEAPETPPKITLPDAGTIHRIFDFTRDVKAALHDYPQLRLKTIFANASAPGLKMVGHWFARMKATLGGFKQDSLQKQVGQSRLYDTSYAFSGHSATGLHSIVIKEDDRFVRQMGPTPEKREQSKTFALNHEMGHLLVPGATGTEHDNAFPENAADSFGALRHLQQFDGDTALLRTLSWNRSFMFLASGVATHLTTRALDTLAAKAATTDFKQLSPEDTLTLAEVHARQQTPTREEIQAARQDFTPFQGHGSFYPLTPENAFRLQALAETVLATAHRFTFEVGFRVIRPFLDDGGASLNGQDISLPKEEAARLTQALAEKAKSLSLDHLAQELQENKADITAAKTSGVATPRQAPRPAKQILNVL